jgi:hypothetical protein
LFERLNGLIWVGDICGGRGELELACFAYLFIGVRMVDTGVRREGRALQRRQSMMGGSCLCGMWEIEVVVVVIIVVKRG